MQGKSRSATACGAPLEQGKQTKATYLESLNRKADVDIITMKTTAKQAVSIRNE
jgi:hypothetical protein